MKIPETSANVAAYYGNEENGQWQTNGITLEGGGPVAGGDAGFLPMYPPPPRVPHDPGTQGFVASAYLMTGAYYPAAYQPPLPPHPPHHEPHQHIHPVPPSEAFADYMWMENEEEFDKQVMQELEEEALMEQCIEAMLEDERGERERRRPHANGRRDSANCSNGTMVSLQEQVSKSKLNPLAAEFVPTGSRVPIVSAAAAAPSVVEIVAKSEPTVQEVKKEEQPTIVPTPEVSIAAEPERVVPDPAPAPIVTDAQTDKQDVPEPPEVSAALPESSESDTSIAKSTDSKRSAKTPKSSRTEPKARSKTKVTMAPKPTDVAKRDSRRQKSVSKTDTEESVSVAFSVTNVEYKAPQSPSIENTTSMVPKPINYAAAAKANKPKKSSPVPATFASEKMDKPISTSSTSLIKNQERSSRTEKPLSTKPERNHVRKNSSK